MTPLGNEFYRAALTALPLEIVALFLYVKALKLSPLSLTVPFLSLTPLFLLVIPSIMLGERISTGGGIGVALIASGSYLLNLKSLRNGLLEPFRAIFRERGSLFMIVVALIYSITSTLGKQAITASSPFMFAAFYFPLMALAITPIALWNSRGSAWMPALRAAALPGLCCAVEIVTHMVAVSLTNVAYMIAVKRTSLLMGVLYGHFMFREEGLKERLLGAILMVTGVALILTVGK
jgi:drug/metabolite transporter (DMT)-like permease